MSESDINWISAIGKQEARLASCAIGSGPLFIWGHTLMGSMDQEQGVGTLGWECLQDIARIVRYDARGHGRSASSAEPTDYTWPHLAKDMWAIAEHYAATDKVILGGASMGAATALHAACQRPERTRALVLVIPPTAWDERDTTAKPYHRFATGVEWTKGIPLKMLSWLPPTRKTDLKERIARVTARSMATANPLGISASMRGASLSDLPPVEHLAKLNTPTLILAWPNDPVHPLNTALSLARILPEAQLEISTTTDAAERWPVQIRRFIDGLNHPWNNAESE